MIRRSRAKVAAIPDGMYCWAVILLFVLFSPLAKAQIVGDMEDESKLYAQSKQVNQFFRRFNGEEDEKGNRYYPGDKAYRSTKLRKKYLSIIFDDNNGGMSSSLKTQFAKDILANHDSAVLNFHGPGWFAEVHASFVLNGKSVPVTLFMELEKDHLGSKWVINKAHLDAFDPVFVRDTTKVGRFLHPMSHELDFMNLRKALINSDSVAQFAARKFVPDHLTLFLFEIKQGSLKFQSVEDVRFHFFQIPGWYFELAQFNRPGYNTGWLISALTKLNNDAEKDLLRKHLYYENQ